MQTCEAVNLIPSTLTAVDLFCGCGAVTLGLKNSGFRILAAVDNDPVACRTYQNNHPEVPLYCEDIGALSPKTIMQENLQNAPPELLVVCAPCQPFSNQNQKRKYDPRADLILQSSRWAKVLKPRMIFLKMFPD